MGLQEAFKAATVAAFVAADDLRETVTYRSKTNASATYDPVTGLTTDAYTDYDSLKMIVSQNEQRQIDNVAILPHDDFLMIPVDNLTPTPKVHDLIVRNTTGIWDIVWFKTDAAQALWTFQVRKL
jgi:hypothetical protein